MESNELTKILKRFLSTLVIAITNCSLYSKEHSSLEELAARALSIFNELPEERLEIMIIENDLVINKVPFKDAGISGNNFVKRLKRKGISRVDFLKGVTLSEIKQFIVDISEIDKKLKTYPHIKAGIVDVRISGIKTDEIDFDTSTLSSYLPEQIEKVKDIYRNISPFKRLRTEGLEEIIINFILTFKREANLLKLLSPVKSYSEYTYTHATNVAVLSMFQAESFGMRDELLHDIGLAALLHDVGKLFISKEVLNKKGALTEKEFEEITHHSLYGAVYLAKIDGLTHLAPIVAFEHHKKYDGTGYPKFNVNAKRQHICSQIVAISDFFDALRSWRPYRKALDINEILALMKNNIGKDFNPFLVENFARILLTTQFEGRTP
jgi:HD-GYP domain-containing protein (c-di-GMP phosphodiesterase class II)